jgi:TonB family protein
MLRRLTCFSIALILCLASIAVAQNGSAASGSERKVATRVAPPYPDLAKKLHLHGIVKVEAVVRANGTVKSTRVLGGNPVLGEAAEDAVSKWKFEPTQSDTTEIVQLAFEPQ